MISLKRSLELLTVLPCSLSKSEICYFGHSLVKQDVSDFEVSVDDRLLGQVFQSLESLVDGFTGLTLGNRTSVFNSRLKISVSAHFRNDVTVVCACENLVAPKDVGMVKRLQNLNLGI